MIKPMLCMPSEPFDNSDYLWEIKWDGERAIIYYQNGKIEIQNRKGSLITYRYPELQNLIKGMNCKECILDGEIVILDEKGKSHFNLIALRSHLEKKLDIEIRSKSIPATFMAFDLLSIDGTDIKKWKLGDRKDSMYKAFKPVPSIGLWSLCFEKDGKGSFLFEQAKKMALEGIVGKRIDSIYVEGQRSLSWVKCKNEKTIDMIFNKYTINPAGIRVENENGIAVQVAGNQSKLAKKEIDENGRVMIEVKYLDVTENGKFRMPTCKTVKSM